MSNIYNILQRHDIGEIKFKKNGRTSIWLHCYDGDVLAHFDMVIHQEQWEQIELTLHDEDDIVIIDCVRVTSSGLWHASATVYKCDIDYDGTEDRGSKATRHITDGIVKYGNGKAIDINEISDLLNNLTAC